MSLFSIIPLVLVASLNEQRMATRKVVRRAMTDAPRTCPTAPPSRRRCRGPARRRPGALAYLDLDHFTLINDTASHAAGDALIHGIGSLLKARLREGDRVFRIGGDEFALLLTGEPEAMEQRLQHLQRAIESYRVGWQDHVLNITVSIGLVNFRPAKSSTRACFRWPTPPASPPRNWAATAWCPRASDPREMQEAHARDALGAAHPRGASTATCSSSTASRSSRCDGRRNGGRHFEVLLRMRDPDSGERLARAFHPRRRALPARRGAGPPRRQLVLHWLEERDAAAESVELCAINLTAASLVDEASAISSTTASSTALPPRSCASSHRDQRGARPGPRAGADHAHALARLLLRARRLRHRLLFLQLPALARRRLLQDRRQLRARPRVLLALDGRDSFHHRHRPRARQEDHRRAHGERCHLRHLRDWAWTARRATASTGPSPSSSISRASAPRPM
jgi:diguanylate cyclase (GGDEF)-like protein